jgi:hypothetical protein
MHIRGDEMNPKLVFCVCVCVPPVMYLCDILYTNHTGMHNYDEILMTTLYQLCMQLLSSDEFWMYAPIAFNGINDELNHNISQAQQSGLRNA